MHGLFLASSSLRKSDAVITRQCLLHLHAYALGRAHSSSSSTTTTTTTTTTPPSPPPPPQPPQPPPSHTILIFSVSPCLHSTSFSDNYLIVCIGMHRDSDERVPIYLRPYSSHHQLVIVSRLGPAVRS